MQDCRGKIIKSTSSKNCKQAILNSVFIKLRHDRALNENLHGFSSFFKGDEIGCEKEVWKSKQVIVW